MTESSAFSQSRSKLKPEFGPRIGSVLAAAGILGYGVVASLTPLPGSSAAAQELPSSAAAQELPVAGESPVVPQNGIAELVDGMFPAVFSVRVEHKEGDRPLARFFSFFHDRSEHDGSDSTEADRSRHSAHGQASGFFVSPDGYAVTNDYEIREGDRILVTLQGGEEHEAGLVGTDAITGLALLKLDLDEPAPYVAFADDDNLRVGDRVVAVGNPFGLGGTVTSGVVSGRGGDIDEGRYDDFIRIDAPISRGSSGGPTFDLNGKVVGVNAMVFTKKYHDDDNGFTIPASTVKSVVADLMENGTVSRGWLGVRIEPLDEDMAGSLGLDQIDGAVVSKVLSDSPAEIAGLRSGDVILKVDDEEIESPRDLSRLIASLDSDHNSTLRIWRDGGEQEIAVILDGYPDRDRDHNHRRGHYL